jgi:mono/diheme cytochrome c family protein
MSRDASRDATAPRASRAATEAGAERGEQPADDLEPDVERLHRAIAREPRDPEEGREPAPWWLWTVAVLAIFWGGWYLGRFGGTFGTATHVAIVGRDPSTARQARDKAATAAADPIQAGRQVFMARCQACHQADGKGLAGTFPPLVGSEWVTGPPEIPVHIVLDGLQGPVHVAGQTYNGVMPAWRSQLSNQEIAGVLSYVRQWKPNNAPPVDSALVARLRAETAHQGKPWTEAELRALGSGGRAASAAGGAP